MSKFTKKNKEHLDSMVIGQGHTIMAGYIPEAVGAQTFSENYYKWKNPTPDTIAQFGFWGGDIDYNTYYPNLDKSELTPKDEEFIEPMFRLLSETIVSKNWNPTDFGQNGVLKASMKMLLGQTVNCDHETNIGNAIGAVSQVMWQESYKDGSFTIPAGINGILKIDGKANPRIARGILMEPPSIHSNSVTVQFKWDKSHPQMEDNEFYQKLGTYDSKGVMVRRIVTDIVRYLETALVSHGADSFAQKIGSEGKNIKCGMSEFKGINASTVTLSYNKITKFPTELFASGSPISTIDLSNNLMTSIPENSLKPKEGNYKNTYMLTIIDLRFNKLTSLSDDFRATTLPYLSNMDVSYNCFSTFPTQPLNSSQLKAFGIRHQRDAEGNRILRQWPTGITTCPSLIQLQIGSNDIRKVDETLTPQLYILDIADNPNISIDVTKVCPYIEAGMYALFYDTTQDIRGCDALGIER